MRTDFLAFIELHCIHAVLAVGCRIGLGTGGERPAGAPTDEEIERMIEERHLFAKRLSVKESKI